MDKKKSLNHVFIIATIFIFVLILMLNMNTTYVVDDFNNMFIKNNVRITKISQVLSSQVYRYYNTNGRILAHTIGGVILMFNKNIINVLNSAGFCILIYQIYRFRYLDENYGIDTGYKHYKKIIRKNRYGRHLYKTMFYLSIFFFIWKFTPVFGQDFLWIIGSANYMWTNIILLGALLIARSIFTLNKEVKGILAIVGIIAISLMAGMTNENSVPAAITIMIYYTIKMYKNKHKETASVLLMLISMIAGFIVMITAPGNFRRITFFKEPDGLMAKYLLRMDKLNYNFIKFLLVLLVISLIILIIARLIYNRKNFESEVYILAAIVSNYAMVMAPTCPLRVLDITVILLVISMVMNISIIGRFNIVIATSILSLGVIFGGYWFATTYPDALKDSAEYAAKYSAREIIIKDAKNMGHFEDIKVPELVSENPYTAAYGLEDCKTNKEDWINVTISRYYGVLSVILRK